MVTPEVGQLLKCTNQADECARANRLWFCFFEPALAGQHGIERFFKYWGGEALYNSHENDAVSGEVLRSIGIPCVIKAIVPIASMNDSHFPDAVMARKLLLDQGHTLENVLLHEGFSMANIPASKIIEIIEHPSAEFCALTGCMGWRGGAL